MAYFEDRALPLILIFEGGFTDDPTDRGGRTNKGITQHEYDAYRAKRNLPTNDVKNISDDEIHNIYLCDYWLASKCDQMEPKIATVVFDTAVNNGQGRSIMILQQSIGAKVDGIIGQETLYKLTAFKPDLANYFLITRNLYYDQIVKSHPEQIKFLAGWKRRVKFLSDFISGIKTLDQIKKDW